MPVRNFLRRLRDDNSGSALIEFALIGPAMLAFFFGVLQFGIGMRDYNALRSISADTARNAVTQGQRATTPVTDASVQTYARQIAIRPPYGLRDDQLVVTCADAGTQRVLGATEKTLTITYNMPSMLGMIGINSIPMTFTRPIFLVS